MRRGNATISQMVHIYNPMTVVKKGEYEMKKCSEATAALKPPEEHREFLHARTLPRIPEGILTAREFRDQSRRPGSFQLHSQNR